MIHLLLVLKAHTDICIYIHGLTLSKSVGRTVKKMYIYFWNITKISRFLLCKSYYFVISLGLSRAEYYLWYSFYFHYCRIKKILYAANIIETSIIIYEIMFGRRNTFSTFWQKFWTEKKKLSEFFFLNLNIV